MMNISKEGEMIFKNGKKPIRLIKQLIKWIGAKDNDIILDFFSGSSTTAHAVMQFNAEDGGNRKYIMVQLPEKTNHSEYKNICEIGKERIKRVGNQIKEKNLDFGFKVFRLED